MPYRRVTCRTGTQEEGMRMGCIYVIIASGEKGSTVQNKKEGSKFKFNSVSSCKGKNEHSHSLAAVVSAHRCVWQVVSLLRCIGH